MKKGVFEIRDDFYLDGKPFKIISGAVHYFRIVPEYWRDKTNIIHCPIGKVSFGPEKLMDNYNALMGAIVKAKPASAKGQYIKSCVAATTMGPGVKMNTAKLV